MILYSGLERDPTGAREGGYLHFERGTMLRVLSAPFPGHEGNVFCSYVFAEFTKDAWQQGWVPTALLHQMGRRSAHAFTHGLQNAALNDMHMRPFAKQFDRTVVASAAGSKFAVKVENLVFVDWDTDLQHLLQRRMLLKLHPDKGGEAELFLLVSLLRRCALAN